MSFPPDAIFGGSGFYGFNGLGNYGQNYAPVITTAAPAPDKPARPDVALNRSQIVYGGVAGGACGYAYSPAGYADLPPFTDNTMWLMSSHSTLAFVYSNIVSPITAGTYTVEVNPSLIGKVSGEELAKRKRVIEAAFRPHVSRAVRAACRALQYGRWTQEVIYDRLDGFTVPVRFKSFLPWEVVLMQDPFGDFAGVRYNGEERDSRYLYHHVNCPELHPIFGESRHRGVVPEWWAKLKSAVRIATLADMANSIVPIVKGPTGNQIDATGEKVSGLQVCKNIAAALARREAVFMNQYIMDDDEMNPSSPELSKFTAFDIETVKLGEQGPAMSALLNYIAYDDVSMSRGWHQPERASMEGRHGTKAEAGVHKSAGVEDSESVYGDAVDSLNYGPVDRTLIANFGKDAKGSIFIKPSQLQDPDKLFKQDNVLAQAANPVTADQVAANLDIRQEMEQVGLALVPEEDAKAALASSQAKQQAQQDAQNKSGGTIPAPTNGKPANGKNGGGKPANGRMKIAASGDGLVVLQDARLRLASRLLHLGEDDRDPIIALSANDGDGVWRTINGAKVFIKDGVVTKGPASLKGKTHAQAVEHFHGKPKGNWKTPHELPGENAGAMPSAKKWKNPPLPKSESAVGGKAGGMSASGMTNTQIGDLAEHVMAKKAGFKSLLPEGERRNPLDVKWDESDQAFEVKACSTAATEYKSAPKGVEVTAKGEYAKQYGYQHHLIIAVVDPDEMKIHAYMRRGTVVGSLYKGGSLNDRDFEYLGSYGYTQKDVAASVPNSQK